MHILLADDHEMLRDGMRRMLNDMDADIIIHEAASLPDVLEVLDSRQAMDMILIDLTMPGMNGVRSIDMIHRSSPAARLLIISACEDSSTIQAAIQAGASGYIPKSLSSTVIHNAIRLVVDGGVYLPPHIMCPAQPQPSASDKLTLRQHEIMVLLTQGLSNKNMARQLGLAEGTIRQHLHAIYESLSVTSRTQAVLKAQELGLESVK